ncbi:MULTISPECIES: ATP-binding protein [unclassified Pseudoclavibacter]|uniref:ATP-binding protein n=1 Tax=unclassified Pseudoclavibacter TaxID=2615177 RepID=UPI001BA861F4|nr:ATP-binding protein [Pseudoclavibacter sp. Marseille-Q4354]MBS3178358.1 ATP-binding protein [Pseudoclavibacter sp. Marseille-Q4354]
MYDVFGMSRDVPANYAVRQAVDKAFVDALTQDKHIVIHGSSKQGKTSLRKFNLGEGDHLVVTCSNKWALRDLHTAVLKAAGYVVEGTTTRTVSGDFKIRVEARAGIKVPLVGEFGGAAGTDAGHTEQTTQQGQALELDPNDVNDVISGLQNAEAPKYLVLEDFHYLPEDTQKDFAVALKAFHESSLYSFIVVGVWIDENRMTQHNGDLGGRVVSINVDKWREVDLREVVNEGARLLAIDFAPEFVDAVLESAMDSVWIVQEACKIACEAAGVFATMSDRTLVSADGTAIVKAVVDSDSARFNGFLTHFAEGFQSARLEIYRWLLYAVIMADSSQLEKGVSYGEISRAINDAHPEQKVNAGNITIALAAIARLQVNKLAVKPIVLDYDQTARRLAVVDRSFLVWLQHQDQSDLLEIIGVDV